MDTSKQYVEMCEKATEIQSVHDITDYEQILSIAALARGFVMKIRGTTFVVVKRTDCGFHSKTIYRRCGLSTSTETRGPTTGQPSSSTSFRIGS